MKRSAVCAFALFLALLITQVHGAEQSASADYLKWRGDLSRIESLSFTGTLESSGLSGSASRKMTASFIDETFDLGAIKGGTVIGPQGAFTRTASGQVQSLGTDIRQSQERLLDLLFAKSVRQGRAKDLGEESKNGKRYRVLRLSYDNGDAWDYFIAADGALDWVRAQEDTEIFWIELTHWRTVDGVRFAQTETATYQQAEENTHFEWREIAVNPKFTADAFDRPRAEKKLLSFASGTASETIPIDLFMGVRVFVPVVINGVKAEAILDSGAEATGIDAAFAAKAGLTGKGALAATGSGGAATVSMANNVTMEMPGAKLTGLTVFIADLSELSARFGRPLDIILGQELFNEAVVDVDYPRKSVTFHDAESYRYTGPGETVPLIAGKGGLKQVNLSVEGHGPELFDFDLGNGQPLVVFDDAATRWGLHDGRKTGDVLSGGIGGSQIVKIGRVRDVAIGRYVLHDVPTLFPKTERGSFNTKRVAGNVGAGVFNRFRVIADLTRDMVYLEPQKGALDKAFEQDRAGIFFRIADGKLTVIHVVPGSAAAAAGLKKDDVVTRIGSTVVTPNNWAETARREFRQPAGATAKVTTADGREIALILADYF